MPQPPVQQPLAEALAAPVLPVAVAPEPATEVPEPVLASLQQPKVADSAPTGTDAPKLETGPSQGDAPARPATGSQQGQDNSGSSDDSDSRRDTGTKTQTATTASDAPAASSRNDFAAPLQAAVAAHGTVADQVRAAPHTVAHMAEQIIRKVDGQTTRFDIQLDPLGLGQVDVRIEIGADGQLKAAMSFETQSAANELQARSGELKRALEDAGFNLGGGLSFEVSRDANSSGRDLAQQNQQQHQAQQDNRSGGGRAFQAAMDRTDAANEPVRAGEIYLQRRTQSGIDVRI